MKIGDLFYIRKPKKGGISVPGGTTYVKTYATMCDQRIFKQTHISEVHGCRITPFSEPLHNKHTLISEVYPQILDTFLGTQICIESDTYISELYGWFTGKNHWIAYCVDNTLLTTYPKLWKRSAKRYPYYKIFVNKIPLSQICSDLSVALKNIPVSEYSCSRMLTCYL